MVCPFARQAATEVFRNPDAEMPELPAQFPAPESDAALELSADIKPYYYGKLGLAIGAIVTGATAEFPPQKQRLGNPWRRFNRDTTRHLDNTVDEVMADSANVELFDELSALHAINYRLRPNRHRKLRDSLRGGAGTAVDANIGLLMQKLPEAPKDTTQRIKALKQSYSDLIEIASINRAQLSIVNDALRTDKLPPQKLSESRGTIRATEPLLDIPLNDAMRLRFEILTGSRTSAKTLREIKGKTIPVVGCPILLSPRDLQNFWNYTIDAAVDRDLI